MKYIKKYNENVENIKISFEDAKKLIIDNYSDRVNQMIDDEINNGNWIDTQQMEDEGYESEYDYYIDYGNGEAEDAVMNEIVNDLKSNFELDFDELNDNTNLYDFIKDEFNI